MDPTNIQLDIEIDAHSEEELLAQVRAAFRAHMAEETSSTELYAIDGFENTFPTATAALEAAAEIGELHVAATGKGVTYSVWKKLSDVVAEPRARASIVVNSYES